MESSLGTVGDILDPVIDNSAAVTDNAATVAGGSTAVADSSASIAENHAETTSFDQNTPGIISTTETQPQVQQETEQSTVQTLGTADTAPVPVQEDLHNPTSVGYASATAQNIERTFTTPLGEPVTVLETEPAGTTTSEIATTTATSAPLVETNPEEGVTSATATDTQTPAPVVGRHITYVDPLPRPPTQSEPIAVDQTVDPAVAQSNSLSPAPEGTMDFVPQNIEEVPDQPVMGPEPTISITAVDDQPPSATTSEPTPEILTQSPLPITEIAYSVPPTSPGPVSPTPPTPVPIASVDFALGLATPIPDPDAHHLDTIGTNLGLFPKYFAECQTRLSIVERWPSELHTDWVVLDEDGSTQFSIETSLLSTSRHYLSNSYGLSVLSLRQRRPCLLQPR
jgi:hypothetical protein